jgi:HNH endonuclease/AP2 domain
MDSKIQIRNRHKEIIQEVIVDADDFDYLNKFKWHLNKQCGYVYSMIDGKNVSLHRVVMRHTEVPKQHVIDHINNQKNDNRKINLRIVSYSANAQNKTSLKEHIGVYHKNNKFYASVTYQGKHYNIGIYDSKEEASKERDKAVYLLYRNGAKLNLILTEHEKQVLSQEYFCFEDFLKTKSRKKNCNLPKCVFQKGNTYIVIFKKKTYSGFQTVEDASKHYHRLLEDEKQINETNILNREISRNDLGQAVIPLNKNKHHIKENAIVDDDDWYDLIKFSWLQNKQGYVIARIDSKIVYMHRYLQKEIIPDSHVVDHINQNRLDNRKLNLRVVTYSENNQNIRKTNNNNKTSKYVGVTYAKDKGKWMARIRKNQKTYHLGHFENEQDAARAYDTQAKILYSNPLLNLQ